MNWKIAWETIRNGKEILDNILLQRNIGVTDRYQFIEYGTHWDRSILEFIPENQKALVKEIAKDMKEAKEFLQLHTLLEDTILKI